MVSRAKTIDRELSNHRREILTVIESGRLGGLETLRRYGREHFVSAGQLGQVQFSKRYTREDRRRFGAMGGRPKKRHYMGEKGQSK